MEAVSPQGIGVARLWQGIRAGQNGIDWIEDTLDFALSFYPARFAGAVKQFSVDEHLKRSPHRATSKAERGELS